MRFKGKKPVFSYKDTFGLDSTLAPVICEGLKKFLEVLKERDANGKVWGVPMWAYEEAGCNPHEDGESDKEAVKTYFECLEKMIYSFDVVANGNGYPFHLADFDSHAEWVEALRVYQEHTQEGLELFGKHFQSLWW